MGSPLAKDESVSATTGTRDHWRALVLWFALTLLISWGIWIPLMLIGSRAASENGLVARLAVSGPTLAAFVVVLREGGWRGLRELLRGLTVWRVGVVWYLIALLLPSAFGIAALAIEAALGGGWRGLGVWTDWSWYPVGFWMVLLGGPLGVEIGVRGFAQGRLQAAGCTALVASLIAGASHAIWHLPTLAPGGSEAGLPVGWFFVMTVTLGVLAGWVYNNTRGSTLLALVVHTGANLAMSRLPLFQPGASSGGMRPFYLMVGLAVATAAGVAFFAGPERLSRQPPP
jgi:membrane protease YdiL (CAAX protease family)